MRKLSRKKHITNKVIVYILLVVFPPLGIYSLWVRDGTSRNKKILGTILSSVWFVLLCIAIAPHSTKSLNAPSISVAGSVKNDTTLSVVAFSNPVTIPIDTGYAGSRANTTLTVNGKPIAAEVSNKQLFKYTSTVTSRQIILTVVATNDKGKDTKKILVTYSGMLDGNNIKLDSSKIPESTSPTISVEDAVENGSSWQILSSTADYTIKIKYTNIYPIDGDTITVNGSPATNKGIVNVRYEYETHLSLGDNNFVIVAKNTLGEATKTLNINYNPDNGSSDDINGKLAVYGSGIVIVNESGSTYSQCSIELNNTLTTRPYTSTLKVLAADSSTLMSSPNFIPYSSFSKSTGQKYDPSTTDLKTAYVSCYDTNSNEASLSFSQ